jgi:prepilin-type N-terminal cleavage/methylation domain-containing protein
MSKAFTLIELLVVLILIALISAMIAPRGSKLLTAISTKIEQHQKVIEKNKQQYQAFIEEIEIINDENQTFNTLGITHVQ